jgi:hypothetical protein
MTSSLRSALWMLLAVNLLGAVAFAETGAPSPAIAPTAFPAAAPAGTTPPPAATKAPPAALGSRSLIGARCKDDIAKHCPTVAAGGGRLAACLRSHEAELSEACKSVLPPGRAGGARPAAAAPQAAAPGAAAAAPTPAAAPAARPMAAGKPWGPMKGMHRACGGDVAKLCKDVAPGHGRVAACLNEHAADLSPGCKPVAQHIAAKMDERMSMHADCADDAQKHCSDVPAGSGRVGLCLGEHAAELSASCKKHLDEMKAHFAQHGKAGKGHDHEMMGGKGGATMVPKPNPGAAAPSPGAPLPPPVTK